MQKYECFFLVETNEIGWWNLVKSKKFLRIRLKSWREIVLVKFKNDIKINCEVQVWTGLSIEVAVNFFVIAFRFFSEKKHEEEYLPAVLRKEM